MPEIDHRTQADQLTELLSLAHPPLAIHFSQEAPAGVSRLPDTPPEPTPDGRTGKVSASCVFWVRGETETFTTIAEDHGNCSVGSVTHGFKTLEEVADRSDVATLVGSGWVSAEAVPSIPAVRSRPRYITYGPLRDATAAPDVVFLRVSPKQAMVLSDALPELRFEGKPQCHILAIAKEQGEPAVSVGCMLSRVRTGIGNAEMSCALPGPRLDELLGRLRSACGVDDAVAAYASEDARRFG